jgi:thymidylate synthase (FAD)
MKVTLLNDLLVKFSLEKIGEFASICKNQDMPSKEQLVKIGKSCMRQGHFSTCRGIMWHFQISGISRVCSHQLVRHHVGIAVNQSSNVFQDANTSSIILPVSVTRACEEHGLTDEVTEALNSISVLYHKLRECEVSSSDARYILPQGLETSMNIALTPEALIHLAHERLCSKAQWEIRGVVQRMCQEVIQVDSFWKELLTPKCIYLHGCPERLGCGYYNAYANNTRVSTAEHIERRMNIETCDNCGRQLAYKDDDPNPMIQDGIHMYCKECYKASN